MAEVIYDRVKSVAIGTTAGASVTITNVLAFAYRIVTVEEGMVVPISVINDDNPSGVHQGHSYYEMLMVLDTDWLVDEGNATSIWAYGPTGVVVNNDGDFAIDEDGENGDIEYFVVTITEHDATETTLTFADGLAATEKTVWCMGETSEFSNEDGAPHQTVTYRFICLGDLI